MNDVTIMLSEANLKSLRAALASAVTRTKHKTEARRAGLIQRTLYRGYRDLPTTTGATVRTCNVLGWAPPYTCDGFAPFSTAHGFTLSGVLGDLGIFEIACYATFGNRYARLVVLDFYGVARFVTDDYRAAARFVGKVTPAEKTRKRHRETFGDVVRKFRELSGMRDRNRVPLGIVCDWAQERDETTAEELKLLHEARDERAEL